MGESRERDGFFGKYTEHFDDDGNKIGESRERDGFFGKYTEHTDTQGNKTGESREREGFFGNYTEHTDSSGSKTGESRERDGFFGDYTEHVDAEGNKVGESRERDGFFGRYTEHTGSGWIGKAPSDSNTSVADSSSGTSSYASGGGYSASSSPSSSIGFDFLVGLFCIPIAYGAMWITEHNPAFSVMWWLAVIIGVPAALYAIRSMLTIAAIVGALYLIFLAIGSFLKTETSSEQSLSETAPANNTEQAQSRKSPEYSGETGVVNTPGDGFLALRSEPSTNQGSRLLKIPHATPLDIGECVSNSKAEHWCKTTYQGQTGWILDRYIIKEDKARKNISTAEAITLPRGNADRKAILDVIRSDYSRPVIFEVLHLKNSGNWAWATVRPKTADSKEEYEDQSVLLQRNGDSWQKVDGLDHGADCGEEHCPETDIAALQRRHPDAPVSIFD